MPRHVAFIARRETIKRLCIGIIDARAIRMIYRFACVLLRIYPGFTDFNGNAAILLPDRVGSRAERCRGVRFDIPQSPVPRAFAAAPINIA
ncbi:hypothetical protein C6Q03_03295 [Burkholderia multivorans]|nr:hypothetical protein C6Q03_03295 [Burkholderia multivorans]